MAKPCCESKTPIKRALVSSVKVFGEIQARKVWRSLDLEASVAVYDRRDLESLEDTESKKIMALFNLICTFLPL